MKITLVQTEIEDAIKQYIGGQMVIAKGVAVTIELKAGRGEDGYMAFVDIRKDAHWVPQTETTSELNSHTAVDGGPAVGFTRATPNSPLVPDRQLDMSKVPPEKAEAIRAHDAKAAAKEAVAEEVVSSETDAEEEEVDENDQAQTEEVGEVLPEIAEVEVVKAAAPVAEKPVEGKATRAGGRSLFGGLKKPTN